VLTARELAQSVRARMPELLRKLDVDEVDQTLVVYLPTPPAIGILCAFPERR
jgi:hypothetical protein